MVASRAKGEADGEGLSSPDDETIHTVEIGAVADIVELTFQVPAIDVKNLNGREGDVIEAVKTRMEAE